MVYTEVPKSVATFMETITEKCGEAHQDWAKLSGGLCQYFTNNSETSRRWYYLF